MAMQSPSSSFSYGFTYQVFLSFRGTDTRYGFTGNLYKALTDKGINTFIDDNDLQRGDEITPSLIKAIEESRIFIPVFSVNYASSSFCLDELVHIIHCFKSKGRLVLPVFHGVEPTQVRHWSGSYGEALSKHEYRFQNNKQNMERLHQWKIALNQAANFSGYHFSPGSYEYKFIGEIVKYISNKINRVPLHVANYPVGLQSRVQHVKSLLDKGSDEGVYMVGLYGTGGLGKSTLAKAIYNFIADQFDGLCFLHNVRENSTKNKLKHLQEELLLKTIGLEVRLGDTSEGVPIIKERLCRKKILLILDDVDNIKQLHVLAGGLDWFGRGTRVIITTRDKHILTSHEIESVYAMEGLYGIEALELLRWMAFKNNQVPSSYEEILNRAVTYASGHPLAIEIIGSNLFGKSIEEWKNTLEGYEKIPNKEIQKILRISYDALEEEEQSVFLDIACCFKGSIWVEVENILHAHYGHCIKHHVGVLAEKSLIKINSHWGPYVDVTLHDLIEDMGKEVVRQESPKELGERSRLWYYDDIILVLKENTGTSKIEMIYLDFPSTEAVIDWNGKAFKKMKNLRTLIIKNGHFSKGSWYLPSGLRVLEWPRYPLGCIPFSISNKTFEKMKILKLDNCEYLTNISDVSCLPNLEIFSFKKCENLISIDESIGFLDKLQILNAEGCDKLSSFPPLKLNSLRELELSFCKILKKFPEILDKMNNINNITLIDTGIKEFPSSFQNLTELHNLSIRGHGKLIFRGSIPMMSNLSQVDFDGYSQFVTKPNDELSSLLSSNVKEIIIRTSKHKFLAVTLTLFSNVETLDISGSDIKILPECIKNCCFLKSIYLDYCQYLEEIRGIPPNLKSLSALGCESLTSSSKSMLVNQKLHEAGGTEFRFPSSRSELIPEWFEHQRREQSISFSFRNNFPSLVFYLSIIRLYECKIVDSGLRVYLLINDYAYTLDHLEFGNPFDIPGKYTYIFSSDWKNWLELGDYTPKGHPELKSMLDDALLKNEWIHAEVKIMIYLNPDLDSDLNDEDIVVESGIHVLKNLTSMDDIQFSISSLSKKRKLYEFLNESTSE
ncbi:disease resistance protein RPV1-like [Vicia villosa]|uniref:disease resistance protein RPV1-like n=1 Tax=Vicia villosa TaxID=3911 RepID=UPI00273C4286|nr:disease resistance protein RPV1-like [Vicia villosa]